MIQGKPNKGKKYKQQKRREAKAARKLNKKRNPFHK
jgi:hypothetical protein